MSSATAIESVLIPCTLHVQEQTWSEGIKPDVFTLDPSGFALLITIVAKCKGKLFLVQQKHLVKTSGKKKKKILPIKKSPPKYHPSINCSALNTFQLL